MVALAAALPYWVFSARTAPAEQEPQFRNPAKASKRRPQSHGGS